MTSDLFTYTLRLADDAAILGQRLGEWCGHAPTLEEDIGLANVALDHIGQARNLYSYAGEVEGAGRDEDQLCFLRKEREFGNCLLVEQPNGDFAQTIARQLFFSAFMLPFWRKLTGSRDETLAAIAAKAEKESAYHVRHCAEWIIRLVTVSGISSSTAGGATWNSTWSMTAAPCLACNPAAARSLS